MRAFVEDKNTALPMKKSQARWGWICSIHLALRVLTFCSAQCQGSLKLTFAIKVSFM